MKNALQVSVALSLDAFQTLIARLEPTVPPMDTATRIAQHYAQVTFNVPVLTFALPMDSAGKTARAWPTRTARLVTFVA
jgi:hypothetical protein